MLHFLIQHKVEEKEKEQKKINKNRGKDHNPTECDITVAASQ